VPSQSNAGLIRLGILALPLSGLLSLVGALGDLGSPDPEVDPRGAAQAAVAAGYFLTQFVGNTLSVTLAIFGFIALFAYLSNTSGGRLAAWAMVLSVSGLCLLLSFFGVITLALPGLAQEYLNGQQEALQISDALFGSRTFALIILAGLLYSIGFILFGVAIWRSETLPKWAGVLLAVAGLPLAVPADIPGLNILGTVLLIVAGGWIALSILRQPSPQAMGGEAQPRVR
jgi:hypothetical protein